MIEIPMMPTSYPADWVTLLLRPVQISLTPVAEKESLIQSGQKHYSEMLSVEKAPSAFHLDLYQRALAQYQDRLAMDMMRLAQKVCGLGRSEIIFASLVRAGIPLGILLKLACQKLGYEAQHYGISIIRDRGLDDHAMTYLESLYQKQDIFFVDGWTGKGAISAELQTSLQKRGGYPDQDQLIVLSDLSGTAWLSADQEDWLIPFGLLGAPIAGLISRSLWSDDDFHGGYQWDALAEFDQSCAFIDQITARWEYLDLENLDIPDSGESSVTRSQKIIAQIAEQYQVKNLNRIKPGIAEATRAVLRRLPEQIIVQDRSDPDVALLIYLAEKLNLTVTETTYSLAPYRAITIIQKIGQDT